jgi:AbrB family looped-hinge helix DNA binding protein
MTSYTTITEKGQITLPVEIRKFLNLTPGKKLKITIEDDHISITKPIDIKEVRQILKAEMIRSGTEDHSAKPQSGDGWTSHVKEKYGRKS